LLPSGCGQQQQVEPATPQVSKQPITPTAVSGPWQMQGKGRGSVQFFVQTPVGTVEMRACADARGGRSAAGTAAATTAPPSSLSARERGIGSASARASPSRKPSGDGFGIEAASLRDGDDGYKTASRPGCRSRPGRSALPGMPARRGQVRRRERAAGSSAVCMG
jgi:hypothetical protein